MKQKAGHKTRSSIYYLHDDLLGSTHTIASQDGEILQTNRYDPFGTRVNPLDATKPLAPLNSPIHTGFTGHEHDDEVGLINMKGRIYDPKTARFLTPDPIIQEPYFGQSLNRYSYVLNSPTNYIDPSGFEGKSPPEGAGVAPLGGGGGTEGLIGASAGSEYKEELSLTAGRLNQSWLDEPERRAVYKKMGITSSVSSWMGSTWYFSGSKL